MLFMLVSTVPGYALTQPVQPEAVSAQIVTQVDAKQKACAAYYRHLFEELAPRYGGKAAWDMLLERLAPEIGFEYVPQSVRISIADIWDRFLEVNKKDIEAGEALHKKLVQGEENKELLKKIRQLIAQCSFPPELEMIIREKTKDLNGLLIDRSSGAREDGFLQSLAGIFTSKKKRDERFVVQGVKEIFAHALETMWCDDASAEWSPFTDGVGIVVQSFVSFDASGTVKTNQYGHVTVEAVIGDAVAAVKSLYANTCQFVFDKKAPESFKYQPAFLETPFEFRFKEESYSMDTNPQALRKVMERYPKINGTFSPMTKEQALKLYTIVTALEHEMGFPLDIEWGELNGNFYLTQMRPMTGDFSKPLVKKSEELAAETPIAETPIVIGATNPEGFTGPVVLIGEQVDDATITRLENEPLFKDGYIRVQHDVATAVGRSQKTRARVLADPYMGSRNAHNITNIEGRISRGEFAYANGPILRKGLLENLTFVPHPDIEGVWIAKERATFFSNGLTEGVFYDAWSRVEGVADVSSYYQGQLDTLRHFLFTGLNQTMNEDEVYEYWYWLLTEKCDYTGSLKSSPMLQAIVSKVLRNPLTSVRDIWYMVTVENEGESSVQDLRDLARIVEDLCAVISFPLCPAPGEHPLIKMGRRLMVLHNIDQEVSAIVLKNKPPRPDTKYRVVMYDAHPSEFRFRVGSSTSFSQFEKHFAKKENCAVNRVQWANTPTNGWDAFERTLESYNYDVDCVLIHERRAGEGISVLNKIQMVNPSAYVALDTKTFYDEDVYKKFDLRGIDCYHNMSLADITVADEHYERWMEKQAKDQRLGTKDEEAASGLRSLVSGLPSDVLPPGLDLNKMRVLFVDDFYKSEYEGKIEWGPFKKWIESYLAQFEFLSVKFAASKEEVLELSNENAFDLVVVDAALGADAIFAITQAKAQHRKQWYRVCSGDPGAARSASAKWEAGPILDRINWPEGEIRGKKNYELRDMLKRVFQEYVQYYEPLMEAAEKTKGKRPEAKDQRPETKDEDAASGLRSPVSGLPSGLDLNSMRVLIVDDECYRGFTKIWCDRLFPSHKLTYAVSVRDARKEMEKQSFDVIISDTQLPDADNVKGAHDVFALAKAQAQKEDRKVWCIAYSALDDMSPCDLDEDVVTFPLSRMANMFTDGTLAAAVKRIHEEYVKYYEPLGEAAEKTKGKRPETKDQRPETKDEDAASGLRSPVSGLPSDVLPPGLDLNKMRVLVVDDELKRKGDDGEKYWTEFKKCFESYFSQLSYVSVQFASSLQEVETLAEKTAFDWVITDNHISGYGDGADDLEEIFECTNTRAHAEGKIQWYTIYSALPDKVRTLPEWNVGEIIDKGDLYNEVYGRKNAAAPLEQRVKSVYEDYVKYYEPLVEQIKDHRQKIEEKGKQKTIFVVNNNHENAKALCDYLKEQDTDDAYQCIPIDSMFHLRRTIEAGLIPSYVITDTGLMREGAHGNDDLHTILTKVCAVNPQVKVMVWSSEAPELDVKEIERENNVTVRGAVDALFSFEDIWDMLQGTYEEKQQAAAKRFKKEILPELGKEMLPAVRTFSESPEGLCAATVTQLAALYNCLLTPYKKRMLNEDAALPHVIDATRSDESAVLRAA